jgi:DNA polymerase Ligase (LigD)
MPRFVLLEHRWDGVHWDFMLEHGEVLRTWAIDVPVVAGEDLPARALPDHRRLYLDYEGEVARDRGTVRRLDAGPYRPLVWTDDLVRVRLQGSQLVGEVGLRQVGAKSVGASSWIFRLGNFD